MFWNKKNNKQQSHAKKNCVGKNESKGQSASDRFKDDPIRAQALANARAARENLGDETVQRIAEIMKRMENSPMAVAQKKLESVDVDRMLDEVKWMLDSRDN